MTWGGVVGALAIVLAGAVVAWNATRPRALVSVDGTLSVAASSLTADAVIRAPLALSGTVTGGGWFFEGVFPIEIVDAEGRVIGSTTARAGSDWTSAARVTWTALLAYPAAQTATGTVIFKSDNPSGDPARQKTFSVPVRFR